MRILYVGIDVGKRFCQLFAFTEAGEVFEERIGTLDEEIWVRLFEGWSREFEVRSCFEAGAHYEWMYDFLRQYCSEVAMIDPAQFGVISKSQKKTDKIDARKLAEGLRRGDLPCVFVPEKEVRGDRRLVSFVHAHSRRTASLKTRLRSLLMTYRLSCPCSDVASRKAQKWFEEEGKPRMDEQGRLFAEMTLQELRLLEVQRKRLDGMFPERLRRYGTLDGILDSVPGFGPLVRLCLLSSIAVVERFPRAKSLSAYFGTCGRVYQSGDKVHLGQLTKRGNRSVRWLLSQALGSLHRADARARARYMRLRRRKRVGVARAAQVNWLIRIVFHLLNRQEPYRVRSQGSRAKVA